MSGTPLFVSCRAEQCEGRAAAALAEACARSALQADELIPLDWMENICPERWLCQGREVRFDWYADEIPVIFAAERQ